jgi:hypothetical protein
VPYRGGRNRIKLSFELTKHLEYRIESGRVSEEHHLHVFVVALQMLELSFLCRQKFERAWRRTIVAGSIRGIEAFLEANYVGKQANLGKRGFEHGTLPSL